MSAHHKGSIDRDLALRLQRAARVLDAASASASSATSRATSSSATTAGSADVVMLRELRPGNAALVVSPLLERVPQRRRIRWRAVAIAPVASAMTLLALSASTESVAAAPVSAPPAVTTVLARPPAAPSPDAVRLLSTASVVASTAAATTPPLPSTAPSTVPTAQPPRTETRTGANP